MPATHQCARALNIVLAPSGLAYNHKEGPAALPRIPLPNCTNQMSERLSLQEIAQGQRQVHMRPQGNRSRDSRHLQPIESD